MQQVDPVADVQKKWYISPTLSIDYVGYYIGKYVLLMMSFIATVQYNTTP